MREIVSCFDEGKFSVEGYSVRGCDEDHSPCCVCGFAVDNEELYVELEYESGGVRMVPARIYIPKHSLRLSANWSEKYKTSLKTTSK